MADDITPPGMDDPSTVKTREALNALAGALVQWSNKQVAAESARCIAIVRERLLKLADGRDAPTRVAVTIELDQIITAIRRGDV